MASFSARREDHFLFCCCLKRTFPSDFVKLGSEILYLFSVENGLSFLLFALFCLLHYFVRFCLTFLLIWSTHRAEKNAYIRKKLFDVRCTHILQIHWIYKDAIDLTSDGRSVLDTFFFQNEVQRVLYKLVLVTYLLYHSIIQKPTKLSLVLFITIA